VLYFLADLTHQFILYQLVQKDRFRATGALRLFICKSTTLHVLRDRTFDAFFTVTLAAADLEVNINVYHKNLVEPIFFYFLLPFKFKYKQVKKKKPLPLPLVLACACRCRARARAGAGARS